MTPTPDLLKLEEAAAYLRMSKTSFRRRLNRGEFIVIRDRGHILIPLDTLSAYLERHTRHPVRRAHLNPAARRATSARPQRAERPRGGRVRHLWDGDAA